ncbi:hypothetical protein GCM10009753_73190 [Streptantibioticus ferralitis]
MEDLEAPRTNVLAFHGVGVTPSVSWRFPGIVGGWAQLASYPNSSGCVDVAGPFAFDRYVTTIGVYDGTTKWRIGSRGPGDHA